MPVNQARAVYFIQKTFTKSRFCGIGKRAVVRLPHLWRDVAFHLRRGHRRIVPPAAQLLRNPQPDGDLPKRRGISVSRLKHLLSAIRIHCQFKGVGTIYNILLRGNKNVIFSFRHGSYPQRTARLCRGRSATRSPARWFR